MVKGEILKLKKKIETLNNIYILNFNFISH